MGNGPVRHIGNGVSSLGFDVCASVMFSQEIDQIVVAYEGRTMQRCVSFGIGRVDVCAHFYAVFDSGEPRPGSIDAEVRRPA